jgi:hypothetical protein
LDSLILYSDKDKNFTKNAYTNIQKKFKNFLDPVTKLLTLFKALTKNKKTLSKITGNKKQIIDVMLKLNLTNFEKMMATKDIGVVYLNENVECWDYYNRKRSSALCQTCSGRGHMFFNGSRALVRDEDCGEVMMKCSKAFEMTTYFIEVVGVLAEEFDKFIDPILPQTEYSNFRTTASHLIGGYGKEISTCHHNLHSSNKRFDEQKATNLNSNFASAATNKLPLGLLLESSLLCKKFLRLSDSPFIEEIATHFNIDETLFNQAVAILNSTDLSGNVQSFTGISPDRQWQKNNNYYISHNIDKSFWPSRSNRKNYRRRRLQPELTSANSTLSPKNLFAGDVQIVSTIDSSYTSYLGSNGTSNLPTDAGQVFNLTAQFP